MATKLTPLHDRIVVRRHQEPEKTAGGLYIPDSNRDKSQIGTVVSAGKGKTNEDGKLIPLSVKAGDVILFGKYAGSEAPKLLEFEDEELIIMREDEVLGVLEGYPAQQKGSGKKEHAHAR
jgi:chaperonin GroES